MKKLLRLIFALLLIFPVAWSKEHVKVHPSRGSQSTADPTQVRTEPLSIHTTDLYLVPDPDLIRLNEKGK